MRSFEPRALTPRDGRDWLLQAARLLWRRPSLFISVALFAPAGSALLLALPLWQWWLLPGGWITLIATIFCYGLPLSVSVVLACALARAVNRDRPRALRQLWNRTALRVLIRSVLLLCGLLLQGYLLVYWVQNQIIPADLVALTGKTTAPLTSAFGVANTLLGTQLSIFGGMVLVLQVLLALFIVPLQLFRAWSLAQCWRRSVLALQLNAWLLPMSALIGLALLFMPFFKIFSIPAQILALPLPAYFGALMYVAWNDIFQGGADHEQVLDTQAQWPTQISAESTP